MTSSMYSPSWYRVAGLKPRLRGHVEIHRHHYRKELWYVLEDHSSGRYQRFTPVAYQVIGLFNGERTVQKIWDMARAQLGEDAPTQEEMIRLLSQLHAADALQSDVLPDTWEMLKRYHKQRFGRWKQNLRSPLFMRFPLFDPERILTRLQFFVRPFFSWAGVLFWLIVVGMGIFTASVHYAELTLNITDRILSPGNLVVIWLTFPLLKTIHEFAHAFAVKLGGGEVHEMGIMLLVFTPIPYVDASSASAFHKKRHRILVDAAGMAAEMFVAAIAVVIWVNMEPGPIRSLLYNVIFIAGVSSLFFNGNPLLRYDAYYMLSDILEIPNLGPRGNRYVWYLVQRYLLNIKDAAPPITGPGERGWFVVYTLLSFAYRMFVYVAIIMFVASKFFFVGVLFACWGMFSMFIMPVFKGLKFLMTSPALARHRNRGILAAGIVVFAVIAFIGVVPLPLSTVTEGVVWLPEKSFVRVGTDGFVEKVVASPSSFVKKGIPLIKCTDPLLPANIKLLEAQLQESKVLYDTQIIEDRVKAEITKKEIENISAKLEDARKRADELTIYSEAAGVFIVPTAQDLPSRFVKRGHLLGYVLDSATITARVVVSQSDADLVRRKTHSVSVRFPENIGKVLPAVLQREVPAATDQLPGRVLSKEGGGTIAIDPMDMDGNKAFEKMFLFDIKVPSYEGIHHVGGRVYVRFNHGAEPIVQRWYRGIRQLFLRKFNV